MDISLTGDSQREEISLAPESTSEAVKGNLAVQRGKLAALSGKDYEAELEASVNSTAPWDDFSLKVSQEASARAMDKFNSGGSAEELVADNRKIEENNLSRLSVYEQALRDTGAMEDADDERVKQAAWGMLLNDISSEMYEEEGMLDTVLSIGGMIIPTREPGDVAELGGKLEEAGYLEDSENWLTAQFTSGNMIKKMHEAFYVLPTEAQVGFATTLAKSLKESTDNPLIAQSLFDGIIKGGEISWLRNLSGSADIALLPFDVVPLVIGGVKAVSKLSKAADLVELSKNNNSVDIAELAVAASKDPDIATAVGASPEKVSEMLDVFSQGAYKELVDGTNLPNDVAQRLDLDKQLMEERIKWYYKYSQEEGILSPEREKQIMLLAEQKVRDDHTFIGGMSVVNKDREGFELEFEIREVDEFLTVGPQRSTLKQNFKWNDLNEIQLEDTGYFFGLDPNSRFKGDLNSLLVKGAERNIRDEAKAASLFSDLTSQALGKIKTGAGKDKVLNLLQEGGEKEEVYSAGVLKDSFGFSDDEIDGYLNFRMLLDYEQLLKEKEMIKIFKGNGVKFFNEGTGGSQAVKVFDDAKEARATYLKDDFNHIGIEGEDALSYNVSSELTPEKVDEMYKAGYKLANTENVNSGIKVGDSSYGWAFVKSVEDPSLGRTLSRVKGYFPRSSDVGYYFLKEKVPVGIKGYKPPAAGGMSTTRTVAFSDGKAGLLRHLDALAKETGEAFDPKKYEIVPDGQMPEMERARNVASTSGGLYTGKRATNSLQYVSSFGDNAKPKPAAALQRMNRNASGVLGKKMRNSVMEQQLIKSARETYGISANSLDELKEGLGKITNKTERFQLSDAIRRVEAAKGMPTGVSATVSDAYWAFGERLAKMKGLEKVPMIPHPSRLAYGLASGQFSVGDALRAAAFTCYLGMGSIAQLLVQGSGSFVAMMANPVSFTKAMPAMVGGWIIDTFSTDMKAQKQVINQLRSLGMGDYADGYELWRASGFHDAVLDMQSDALSMFNTGDYASTTGKVLSKGNTLFYSQGELMTSRASFFTALKKYQSDNPKFDVKNASAEDLEKISQRAEQYRLNMSRGNESVIQSTPGINVMFQFWQVIHKFLSKILPKRLGGSEEFSKWEKGRVVLGTVGLFGGTSTIPMGESIVNGLLNAANIDPNSLSEEDAVRLRYGALGYTLRFGLGLENDITTRVSLGVDFAEDIYAALTEQSWTRAVLGASGGILERGMSSINLLSSAFKLGYDSEEEFTVDDLEFGLRTITEATFNMFSSSRNAQIYWANVLTESPALRNSTGEFVLWAGDMPTQTRIAAMLGFTPTQLTEMWELKNLYGDEKRPRDFNIEQDLKVVMRLASIAMSIDGDTDGDGVNNAGAFTAKLGNQVMLSYPKGEREKFFKQAMIKLTRPQNNEERLVAKAIIDQIDKIEEGENKMSVLLSKHHNPSQFREVE